MKQLSDQELAHIIASLGNETVEKRQIFQRMQKLSPGFLKQIELEYRKNYKPGKAYRLALNDPRYLDHLNQQLELQHAALISRIAWENHRRLFDTRRSLRRSNPLH